MKIGRGVSELWRVENRPLPLTWPMAYTTACTTVQAGIDCTGDECLIVLISLCYKIITIIPALEGSVVVIIIIQLVVLDQF